MIRLSSQDLNYVEQSLGGPYLPVAMLPEKDKLLLAKMESRLPLEIFEEVLRAATDACQQVRRGPIVVCVIFCVVIVFVLLFILK